MGLFSFLFGGKKKELRAKPVAEKAVNVVGKPAAQVAVAAAKTVETIAPVVSSPGIVQAKLRLKLAASLRSGQSGAAYEAAKQLADIQVRAGRKTVARVWQQQAERIKATLGA